MGNTLWFSNRIRGNGGNSDRSHVMCNPFVPLWKADQTQIRRLENYQLVRKRLLNRGLYSIVVFYIIHILDKYLSSHEQEILSDHYIYHFIFFCKFLSPVDCRKWVGHILAGSNQLKMCLDAEVNGCRQIANC